MKKCLKHSSYAIIYIFTYNMAMTGPISPLQGILAQYKKTLDKIDIERNKICVIIKNVTGVTVSIKELEISDHILFVRAHPAKRQILMFKKFELLAALQEDEDLKRILDIK